LLISFAQSLEALVSNPVYKFVNYIASLPELTATNKPIKIQKPVTFDQILLSNVEGFLELSNTL